MYVEGLNSCAGLYCVGSIEGKEINLLHCGLFIVKCKGKTFALVELLFKIQLCKVSARIFPELFTLLVGIFNTFS